MSFLGCPGWEKHGGFPLETASQLFMGFVWYWNSTLLIELDWAAKPRKPVDRCCIVFGRKQTCFCMGP